MAGYLNTDIKKVTANQFAAMKRQGEKISMLTAYDFTTATIIDGAGIDGILVGDSASNVMAGNADTLPITLDEMIYHARSVARAVHRALVVCDMPFGTYQVSKDLAVANAVRMMKETGVDALKLEGGKEIADTIKHLVDIGIPVIGHLGLTPQSVHKFGGYGVRAKETAEVTKRVSCATIGIGAGHATDGQILVYADMLGLTQGFKPKFLRQYAHLAQQMNDAVQAYITDVKAATFPSVDESY